VRAAAKKPARRAAVGPIFMTLSLEMGGPR
jgi:hypothetical protein